MPLRKAAEAVKRMVEDGQQEQLSQGLPGDRVRNQLPGKVLPPGGPSGNGYPPAPHNTDWADVTGTPTTLGGYGITDAASDSELATHASKTTSVHGIADTSLLITANDNARVAVRKNSAGSVSTRRRLNLIEGSGVTLTVADDNTNEEVDITIAASGGGGSSLTIEELDGTPSESAPTKLIFPNGTLTVSTHEVTYTPAGGGGGGADAVGTGTSTVTIGGLAGSPDANGVGGAGTSHEFEAGDTAPTWSGAPLATDVGVTAASHLYVKNNAGAELRGLYAWAPGSGAFDVRTKISGFGSESVSSGSPAFGLLITSAGDAERMLLEFEFQNGGQWILSAYTYAGGGYTARGASLTRTGLNDGYLRMTRDGSNNVSFWVSTNGLAWQHLNTTAFTFTVANVGFRSTGDSGGITHVYVDWLRTSV